jgi:hypothetical protein
MQLTQQFYEWSVPKSMQDSMPTLNGSVVKAASKFIALWWKFSLKQHLVIPPLQGGSPTLHVKDELHSQIAQRVTGPFQHLVMGLRTQLVSSFLRTHDFQLEPLKSKLEFPAGCSPI